MSNQPETSALGSHTTPCRVRRGRTCPSMALAPLGVVGAAGFVTTGALMLVGALRSPPLVAL